MAKISSAEWEVMRVLWTKGEATSTEITKILSTKQDWSASTVKTLLGRLADKVLSKICLTKHGHILERLIQQTPMTEEQMKGLQDLLASKVSVERVQCDCHPGQCHCASHVEEDK